MKTQQAPSNLNWNWYFTEAANDCSWKHPAGRRKTNGCIRFGLTATCCLLIYGDEPSIRVILRCHNDPIWLCNNDNYKINILPSNQQCQSIMQKLRVGNTLLRS